MRPAPTESLAHGTHPVKGDFIPPSALTLAVLVSGNGPAWVPSEHVSCEIVPFVAAAEDTDSQQLAVVYCVSICYNRTVCTSGNLKFRNSLAVRMPGLRFPEPTHDI
jgi:hypothetical protein